MYMYFKVYSARKGIGEFWLHWKLLQSMLCVCGIELGM
jgi:hypothetical protein